MAESPDCVAAGQQQPEEEESGELDVVAGRGTAVVVVVVAGQPVSAELEPAVVAEVAAGQAGQVKEVVEVELPGYLIRRSCFPKCRYPNWEFSASPSAVEPSTFSWWPIAVWPADWQSTPKSTFSVAALIHVVVVAGRAWWPSLGPVLAFLVPPVSPMTKIPPIG